MRESIKKLITIVLMITMFIIVGIKDVKAATATASLGVSKTKVGTGESFTVTLKASSEQGLNGVITEVQYDTEKLELTAATAGTNWTNLSSGAKLDLIYNSTEDATTSNVYNMTFKVREGATGEAEIKTGRITIDTMESGNNSMVTEGAKTVKITIEDNEEPQNPQEPEEKELSSIIIAKNPQKTIYSVGDKFDKTGMTILAKYTDGTSKEITTYTYSPSSGLKSTDKEVTISYTEEGITKTATLEITVKEVSNAEGNTTGGNTNQNATNGGKPTGSGNDKDSTVADKDLSEAGLETMILPISVATTLAIIGFIGYRKFNKI